MKAGHWLIWVRVAVRESAVLAEYSQYDHHRARNGGAIYGVVDYFP
ncbi:hypothetical protein MTBPR1_60145 [Candidatus Terasakiella magnetica]|uniref:Uncharacterized protein n=1 Tax=Candidatus Terasakiella magnetica TaxID=1867952 RepID=A0A1C3RK17_9PROT|nr:hypothetical protein MTBPR1_60145 [Candidatus Terasakiella magnetica]